MWKTWLRIFRFVHFPLEFLTNQLNLSFVMKLQFNYASIRRTFNCTWIYIHKVHVFIHSCFLIFVLEYFLSYREETQGSSVFRCKYRRQLLQYHFSSIHISLYSRTPSILYWKDDRRESETTFQLVSSGCRFSSSSFFSNPLRKSLNKLDDVHQDKICRRFHYFSRGDNPGRRKYPRVLRYSTNKKFEGNEKKSWKKNFGLERFNPRLKFALRFPVVLYSPQDVE